MLKKLIGAGVIVALVAVVLVGVGASTASAQTMSLCQTVDALIAAGVIAPDKVAAAKAAAGCSAAVTSGYTFTRDLTIGSTGADVTALQNALIANGFTIAAGATGYFGSQTQAAVVAYQTAKGIAPAVGYVGPLTRAALNYVAPVVVPPVVVPPTTGGSTGSDLEGTFGTISTVDQLSQYSAEEVGAGQDDVKVAGMEITASNDGDIQLTAMKLTFDSSNRNSGDSSRLADYFDSVSIWQGSTRVATADTADFTRDSTGVYSRTLALNNAVIKADAGSKFYITVDAVSNYDSGDIDGTEDFAVYINNIRYVDGSGVTTTETTALATAGAGTLDTGVAIDCVTFSSAADTELKIAASSASPEAQVVDIAASSVTEDVVLLKGTLKLTGTSDVWLDELPITLTSTGSSNVDDVTGTVKLTIDGEEYSESVSSTATTTITLLFDNLDLTIAAGTTVDFTISADIEDTGGTLDDGDTLLASITTTNRGNMTVENEEGEALTDGTEVTGSATGEAQAFYNEGISVTLVGTPSMSKTSGAFDGDADVAVATIAVKVTAFGDTMYFADVATIADGLPHVIATADADAAISVVDMDTSATADDAATGYKVEVGTPRTFTFTITMSTTETTSQLARASITSLAWGSVDGTYDQTYNFNMDDFKSPSTTILTH